MANLTNSTEEIWKGIPDVPLYEASSRGRIKRKKTNRILKIYIYRSKGARVKITHKGTRKHAYVHRLVATVFVPNPKSMPVVNHKDGNCLNNVAANLEWCTQKENLYHSRRISGNGSVISAQKIKRLFEENSNITIESFMLLLVDNCK